jgi:ferrochelatase
MNDKHPTTRFGKVGLLLVNLGTPDATDYWSMRRYLKEFLSDQRVIEVNPWKWMFILNGPILSFRPQKSGAAYDKIWMKDTNESPLRHYTRKQAEKLGVSMAKRSDKIVVDWAMRYGNPSIGSKLEALKKQGCERIAVVPLYPQYSAATTATVCDQTFRELMKMRWQPSIRIAEPYHDHPRYIEGLASSVRKHLATLDWKPDVILSSFHGLPKSYFQKGDPYPCHCQKTGRLLREALSMDEKQMRLTFQSRFGPEEWLQPYTDKTLEQLPAEGIKKVAVICPGFAADCLETLEEIAIAGKESFINNGGSHFTMIPCMNDSEECLHLLEGISETATSGWLTT